MHMSCLQFALLSSASQTCDVTAALKVLIMCI